jgi:hypothetical protein
MRKIILLVPLVASFSAFGQTPFTISGIAPENVPPAALDVNYTGTYPSDPSPYLSKDAWRVWVIKPGEKKPMEVKVEGVVKLTGSGGVRSAKIPVVTIGLGARRYTGDSFSMARFFQPLRRLRPHGAIVRFNNCADRHRSGYTGAARINNSGNAELRQ